MLGLVLSFSIKATAVCISIVPKEILILSHEISSFLRVI